MSKTSKSMWLRRVSQLGLAGALLMPLSLSSSEAAAQAEKNIKDNHLVLFGDFPFDCDKKNIMMNCVCEKYPTINWSYDNKGNLKKQDYDACDSIVCVLAYINQKRYGELNPKITNQTIKKLDNNKTEITYDVNVWDKVFKKKITI